MVTRCLKTFCSLEVDLSHQPVWHIMKKYLKTRTMAIHWVPHQFTEIQKWHQYVLDNHMERYRNEGDTFLQSILVNDEKVVIMP
ncbi:hypothetical protein TNCV_4420981 [Trichonephila clavipes]|nr:hypothetical protein TNCV_4420981 [Trichonephila clavipes]